MIIMGGCVSEPKNVFLVREITSETMTVLTGVISGDLAWGLRVQGREGNSGEHRA